MFLFPNPPFLLFDPGTGIGPGGIFIPWLFCLSERFVSHHSGLSQLFLTAWYFHTGVVFVCREGLIGVCLSDQYLRYKTSSSGVPSLFITRSLGVEKARRCLNPHAMSIILLFMPAGYFCTITSGTSGIISYQALVSFAPHNIAFGI
jgi:hypothetical protein